MLSFKAQLAEIRQQGYAFEDEESTTGVVCLAVTVPTRGAHGPSLGLSVTALKATYPQEQGAQMVKELNELARSLGNPMGYGPPGYWLAVHHVVLCSHSDRRNRWCHYSPGQRGPGSVSEGVLVTTRTDSPLADADGAVVEPEQLRRATLASSVGSALEYYDFYIYGLASALIFGPLFFKPLLGEEGALIASFATYGVGFAARPFGGIVFGYMETGRPENGADPDHRPDGHRRLCIGLLPTFEQAGMLGAVLLVILRIVQGLVPVRSRPAQRR